MSDTTNNKRSSNSSAGGGCIQEQRRIVNPIFFVRGVEPRETVDLFEPVVNAIKLLKEHNLPATFLLQYDALIDKRFVDLVKDLGLDYDIGLWFEVVQQLAEKAGLQWRGRWSWDYESHVAMLVGYTPDDRKKLIDIAMEDFRGVFGHYPQSIGSWVLDAPSLEHLSSKYGVAAACNCKDQCGTDGYTLWGGYWNGGYYPSRVNALVPAQSECGQIPLPVFRMLGSDPIYQYDHNLGESQQGVVSLEPVYAGGGGDEKWVDWFFNMIFKSPCLAFAYTQTGQENSFGWPKMQKGLIYQLKELARLQKQGDVCVETLLDSGKWFKSKFNTTPATAVTTLTDWSKSNCKTVWYNSRFYRTNLMWDKDQFRIRDLHRFDQCYPERYLNDTCKGRLSTYDTLPVIDGYNWSTPGELAGIRLVALANDGAWEPLTGGDPSVAEKSSSDLFVSWPLQTGGCLEVLCRTDSLEISVTGDSIPKDWALEISWSSEKHADFVGISDNSLCYEHESFKYKVKCTSGQLKQLDSHSLLILPQGDQVILNFGA